MTLSGSKISLILLGVLLTIGVFAGIWRATHYADLPDLQDMRAEARKARFIGLMTPMIRAANKQIREDRALLLTLRRRYDNHNALWIWSRYRLDNLAEKYDIDTKDKSIGEIIETLRPRVGIVPPLLVMAQAAKESGWGTSRFAQAGNNLFGQRCREKGCGIVPKRRKEGASYEVQAYSAPYYSIKSYMMNLNTHHAYKDFRARRQKLDRLDTPQARKKLVRSLSQYSERRDDYIEEIIAMMAQIKRESDMLP